MKLINDNKPVNYEEELNISLSLKELLVIYACLATSEFENIYQWMKKFKQIEPIANETRSDDLIYKLYIEALDILKLRNINL